MATKRLKRPRNPIQIRKLIVDIATGQIEDQSDMSPTRGREGDCAAARREKIALILDGFQDGLCYDQTDPLPEREFHSYRVRSDRFVGDGCFKNMHPAEHYRLLVERARHVSDLAHQPELKEALRRAAQDYDDIAEDIESGAIEVRHPELLPQRNR